MYVALPIITQGCKTRIGRNPVRQVEFWQHGQMTTLGSGLADELYRPSEVVGRFEGLEAHGIRQGLGYRLHMEVLRDSAYLDIQLDDSYLAVRRHDEGGGRNNAEGSDSDRRGKRPQPTFYVGSVLTSSSSSSMYISPIYWLPRLGRVDPAGVKHFRALGVADPGSRYRPMRDRTVPARQSVPSGIMTRR